MPIAHNKLVIWVLWKLRSIKINTIVCYFQQLDQPFNTLRPRKMSSNLLTTLFLCTFLNSSFCISNDILLNLLPWWVHHTNTTKLLAWLRIFWILSKITHHIGGNDRISQISVSWVWQFWHPPGSNWPNVYFSNGVHYSWSWISKIKTENNIVVSRPK